jgi:ABC-2 type transport system permease protein
MTRLIESDREAYSLRIVDLGRAEQLLHAQEVAAVIVIPASFDQDVTSGRAAVGLTLNNIDIDFADDIRRAVDRSVAEFDAPQLGASLLKSSASQALAVPNPYRVDVAEHDLRHTNVTFLRYQTVPVLLLVIINVGVLGGALLGSRDHERGTVAFLRTAPIGLLSLASGRLLGTALATGTVLAPLVVALSLLGVVAPPAGHWPPFVAILTATTLLAAGLGVLLGAAFRHSSTVSLAAVIVSSYLFFLGGGFTTIAFLPRWLQLVSRAVPTRYAIDALRQALFYPDLRTFGPNLAALCLFCAASLGAGSLAMRRAWR